jgi:hypothetical protein
MSRARRPFAPVLLVVLLIACGDDPIGPDDLDQCRDLSTGGTAPTFIVSGGERPTISWTPACRLSTLTILSQSPEGGPANWTVGHPEGRLIPPLRFGVLQPGAVQSDSGRSLEPLTTYLIYASYRPPVLGGHEVNFVSNAFTVCGARVSGRCAASPEIFSGVTAEGVRMVATADRASVVRGDTAWVEFRFENPTAQSQTVGYTGACSGLGVVLQRDDWKRLDVLPGSCNPGTPAGPIVVPANGATSVRYPFTGTAPNPAYCFNVARYHVSVATGIWNGGLRTGSNAVDIELRENSAVRARCTAFF